MIERTVIRAGRARAQLATFRLRLADSFSGREAMWAAATALGVSAVTLQMILGPGTLTLALAATILASALIVWPQAALYGAIILGLATLPSFVQTSVHPGPLVVFLFEPLLLFSVVHTALDIRPKVSRQAQLVACCIGAMAIIGWLRDTNPARNLQEMLWLLDVAGSLYVAAGVVKSGSWLGIKRVVAGVLVWSASMVGLAAVGLGGIEGASAAHLGDQAIEATRVLTNTVFLALATVTACAVGICTGRVRARQTVVFWAPSSFILLLSFSRNSLICLAVALSFAIMLTDRRSSSLRRLVSASALLSLTVSVAFIFTQGTVLGEWMRRQGTAYQERVFGGLSGSGLTRDPSAQARVQETENLTTHMLDSPFFGHGLGYAYQQPFGDTGSFTATVGPYYAHNFWLWLLVKGGIPLSILFTVALLAPLANARLWKDPHGSIAAATGAGLTAVCLVAPLPLDASNSLLYGLVLGLAAGIAKELRSSELSKMDTASAPQENSTGGLQDEARPQHRQQPSEPTSTT
ncbi:O-antigen ligase family protein [Modestobacter sp. URMC 112]